MIDAFIAIHIFAAISMSFFLSLKMLNIFAVMQFT